MAAAVIAKIVQDIHKKYLGSGGIEAQDSITFCTYFQQQYGSAEGKQSLKEKMPARYGAAGGKFDSKGAHRDRYRGRPV
jgi:hypothetical protein